jgi:large subunit ribosomal protein L18
MTVMTSRQRRQRRRYRVRAKVSGNAERPRLSVYRSNRGIFAQLIDDVEGRTVASANWTEPELRTLGKMDQARKAGELIAARAKDAGIGTCVFDRSGYRYHGRVKALAEGAREGGLEF